MFPCSAVLSAVYFWRVVSDQSVGFQADDDTFVIVENLRYFLSSHDPSEPVYFGHHFKTIVRQVS